MIPLALYSSNLQIVSSTSSTSRRMESLNTLNTSVLVNNTSKNNSTTDVVTIDIMEKCTTSNLLRRTRRRFRPQSLTSLLLLSSSSSSSSSSNRCTTKGSLSQQQQQVRRLSSCSSAGTISGDDSSIDDCCWSSSCNDVHVGGDVNGKPTTVLKSILKTSTNSIASSTLSTPSSTSLFRTNKRKGSVHFKLSPRRRRNSKDSTSSSSYGSYVDESVQNEEEHNDENEWKHNLWWSKDEMKQNKDNQADMTTVDLHIKTIAKQYLRANDHGRKQVEEQEEQYRSDHAAVAVLQTNKKFNNKKEKQGKNKNPRIVTISVDYYQQLVTGRSHGFAGLEIYTDKYIDNRRTARQIVSKIVQHYQELLVQQNQRADADMKLATYANSLTFVNRSWGCIIGSIDHDAAATATA